MKNFISRRKHEREPREGYAQTLQLSLIPEAKLSIGFWLIMAVVSLGLTYSLKENMAGLSLHGTLAFGAIAIAIKNYIAYRRLKKQLDELLKERPEYSIL